MKIAIIGSGISGLTTAHLLHKEHDITVYEAGNYIGGHVNTIDLQDKNGGISIDTGFIVFNDWTYPNFEKLINGLNVEVQDSEMSFSTKCETSSFEWSGNGLKGLIFNQDNWKQLKPYQIFYDVIRFKKCATQYLEQNEKNLTLGEFLDINRFSFAFIEYYILPMGAAIWSSTSEQIRGYPAKSFLAFFKHHGLLNLKVRPQWKTIVGGSKQYVAELIKPFKNKILIKTPVINIRRIADRIEIFAKNRNPEYFDHVFLCCHSDQALTLLEHASKDENNILGDIQYQKNTAVLHCDPSTMPSRKSAWSSWNYFIPKDPSKYVNVTYYMNRLQNLDQDNDYFVTLNPNRAIESEKIFTSIDYMHPIFDTPAINAQENYAVINGQSNTWYCGAYWRNGFHEDGVWSALRAVQSFKQHLKNEELYIQRAS